MGRLDYQSDNDNDYTESFFERKENADDEKSDFDYESRKEDERGLDKKTMIADD
jgi:hypothetical protein